jgi:hypothetical protein
MKKSVELLAALLLASPWAYGERQESVPEPVILAGEWVSSKPQNVHFTVHFTIDPQQHYSGVVAFNCAKAEGKIRLVAVPSGFERVREISADQPVRWEVELASKSGTYAGELIGGGGRLPDVLISSSAPWLRALGNDGDYFELVIDGTESYQLPTSDLIASIIASCNPPVS